MPRGESRRTTDRQQTTDGETTDPDPSLARASVCYRLSPSLLSPSLLSPSLLSPSLLSPSLLSVVSISRRLLRLQLRPARVQAIDLRLRRLQCGVALVQRGGVDGNGWIGGGSTTRLDHLLGLENRGLHLRPLPLLSIGQ